MDNITKTILCSIIISTFLIPNIYAKDKAEKEFDEGIAEVIDAAENMNTKELTEFCHIMQDDGWIKEEVSCLDWATDDDINHVSSIKNYAIMSGLGIY